MGIIKPDQNDVDLDFSICVLVKHPIPAGTRCPLLRIDRKKGDKNATARNDYRKE
jgi:hypothetical protein